MQTLENDSIAVACVLADSDRSSASYAAVRFNAMKHGILSRLVVLTHEEQAEFDDLLATLLDIVDPGFKTVV